MIFCLTKLSENKVHIQTGYQVFTFSYYMHLFFKFLLVVQMGEEYYHARDFSKALM